MNSKHHAKTLNLLKNNTGKNAIMHISKRNSFSNILKTVSRLGKLLPSFPDGRIDYTHSNKSIAVICFIERDGKILLMKRSDKVGSMHGQWDTAGGYYDELLPPIDIAYKEILEETGILKKEICSIQEGVVIRHVSEKRSSIFCLYYCKTKKRNIHLDYEHTEYAWVNIKDISTYAVTPYFIPSLKLFLPDT